MSLTPKQSRGLLELLRECVQGRAELRILVATLLAAEKLGYLPHDWAKDRLEAARQTPEYLNIAQEYDAVFARAEQATDTAEIERLLETMPSARIEN
jgi:hypothetical protein